MEFRVLGTLEILSGGVTVPLTARKHRELVAALILARNRASRARRWSKSSGAMTRRPRRPSSSGSTSRRYAARSPRLRLETRPGGYLLRVADGELDSVRFDDLLRRGPDRAPAGTSQGAHGLLSAALALWRGPALADVAGREFAGAEAARLDEARIGCLEDRIEADLALGRHAEIVPELEELVAGTRSESGPIAS